MFSFSKQVNQHDSFLSSPLPFKLPRSLSTSLSPLFHISSPTLSPPREGVNNWLVHCQRQNTTSRTPPSPSWVLACGFENPNRFCFGGSRDPLGSFCKGEAGGGPYPGRDVAGVVRFLAFGVLSFAFLLCFFFRRRFWGEDRGAPP